MDEATREFEGKNLDVAVWKASQELSVPIEKLRYKVLSKGKRGSGELARIRILAEGEAPARRKREERATIAEAPPADAMDEDSDAEPAREERKGRSAERRNKRPPRRSAPEGHERARPEPARGGKKTTEGPEFIEGVDEPPEDDADGDEWEPPSANLVGIDEDDPIEVAREARRARAAEPPDIDDAEELHMAGPDDEPDIEVGEEEAVELEAAEGPEPAERVERFQEERPPRRRSRPRPEGTPDPDDLEAGVARAEEVLPGLLEDMGFDLETRCEIEEDHIYVPLEGDDCSYLLDHRAEGLNALQFLLNKMVYRGGPTRILIDANGYRKKRQEELMERARDAADEVREGGQSRSLGSLNPFERRLVHLALQDDEDVRTVSRGDGFMKRIEITPRSGGDDRPERPPRRRRERR